MELLVIKEMNTLEIIVNAVVALIGTSGLITSLLFYSQTKRQKNVETDGVVAEQWKDLAITMTNRYEQIRMEKRELWERYNKAENELVKYKIFQCKKINCIQRQPPLGDIINDEDCNN